MSEPTMADVAAHLGVSRQLVSIVMRDMPGASDATRRRVREAAAELGYQPHIGARSLRQTRSTHIGVSFAPAHASEPDIVEAIYPAASHYGYQVVLSAQTATRSTTQAVEELLGYRCAALIVIGSDLSDAKMRKLARRVKVPMVVIGAGAPNPAYDIVRSAGETGIAALVEHLLGLGHRRIAYVHVASMAPAGPRRQGYLDAMTASGEEVDVVQIPGGDYTEEAGAAAARILLGRPVLPTAVVAGNDQQAVGMITVLSRAGVAVPEQVSVTGFDDSRSARLSSIDLTTARQDPVLMGCAAVEAAVRRIEAPDEPPSTALIESSTVLRSSTAPPPAV
ncbi:MAG TPA: LacI family DNA-binding transcriptional regulator [Friedmanniella sp.]